MAKKLIILRETKPHLSRTIGEVIDSIPTDRFEGKEVITLGKHYIRVIVTDLSDELEEEFFQRTKKLRKPDVNDPFYVELLTKGIIEVTEETLRKYVEDM